MRRKRLAIAGLAVILVLATLGSSPARAVAPTDSATLEGQTAVTQGHVAATVAAAAPLPSLSGEPNATGRDGDDAFSGAGPFPGGDVTGDDAPVAVDESLASIELVGQDVRESSRTTVLVGVLGIIGLASLVALWSVQRYNRATLSNDRAYSSRLTDDERSPVRDCNRIVELLVENDGEMHQSRIVEVTDWSKAKVSRLLSRMEDRGIIQKESAGRQNIIVMERDK